jgi:predicted TIM-barrel fold metal-dependent hydrolase
MAAIPLFDSHAHLISDDPQRYPTAAGAGAPPPAMTAASLVALMDACGVRHALAVQRSQYYGFDNRLVCDAADAYPERLAAVCSVDSLHPDCDEHVHYWVRRRGAVGVRLMETAPGDLAWLAGQAAHGVWRAAAELDIPVCVHFFRWNRVAGLEALAGLLKAYRGVRVVIDHFSNMPAEAGPPDYGLDQRFSRLADYPQVYVKFTTIPLGQLETEGIDGAAVVKRVAGVFGAERLMWGSDITQSSGDYGYMVDLARRAMALLGEREQRLVSCEVGEAVYGWPVGAQAAR